MAASVFQRESRSVQRYVGLPGATKARLWPTVAEILDHDRVAHQEIGDQIVLGALNAVLIKGIIAGRYFEVHDTLGKILGLDAPIGNSAPDAAPARPAGKPLPTVEVGVVRRPLAKART